jgi:hypothetical protein
MADPNDIIRPAPDQTVLGEAVRVVPRANSEPSKAEKNERTIECLSRTLRVINNACEPINDYIKFHQYMTPETRVILDVNQWVMFMTIAKIAIKSYIDHEYMDITDHPQKLKTAMEKAYTGIDSVSDAFVSSMKQIIDIMQTSKTSPSVSKCKLSSETSHSVCESTKSDCSLNVLSSMTTDKLPPGTCESKVNSSDLP